ncbi:hypothetical protein DSECCO2_557000 [anaerobic digester metagenome]
MVMVSWSSQRPPKTYTRPSGMATPEAAMKDSGGSAAACHSPVVGSNIQVSPEGTCPPSQPMLTITLPSRSSTVVKDVNASGMSSNDRHSGAAADAGGTIDTNSSMTKAELRTTRRIGSALPRGDRY